MRQLNARTKLTLISASLFAVAGAGLIVVNYSLVSAGLPVPSLAPEPSGDMLISPGGGPVPGDREVRVAVSESLTAYRDEVLSELLWKSALALVIALALSAVLGWIVAGRVLRPLRLMTGTARNLTHGDLSLRVPVPDPQDEIRDLAETFNEMLERIETSFDQERRLVADLSHEIRTPLANQRVAIEVTLADPDASAEELRAALAVAAQENRRTQLVSERVLELAQAQGMEDALREVVDLTDLVRESLSEAHTGDRRLDSDLAEASTRGDDVLLRRMVDNLIDNAIRHSPAGSRISVRLEQSAGQVVLRVANDGRRLTDAEAAELARPFRRARHARQRSGVGLGLAIVAAVVQRHRGELQLQARDEGGLIATVTLAEAGDA